VTEAPKLLASWRAVIVWTYPLMHRTAHWHYNLGTALASQALAACGLLVIARSTSTGTFLVGLTLLGQLVGYNYFSGLFYSTAGSPDERRALAAGHSRGHVGRRHGDRHDGGRRIWLFGWTSHAVCCGSGCDARIDRCAINRLVEVGAAAELEKGRGSDPGVLRTQLQQVGVRLNKLSSTIVN
jgi:hypothetical protein